MPKPWKRGFHFKNAAGKTSFSTKPVFDDPRKAAQWVEKGSGFYNTSGKWVSTGSKPSQDQIKQALDRSVKLANKKIDKMQKSGLKDFSAELKKHTVFTDSSGFFKQAKQIDPDELAAMLQQVADFNENAETLEELEDAKAFYEDLLEDDEMTEAEREEKIKELRKLVDETAHEIYLLTRDSEFLNHLYNVIDNDVERMDYIKEYSGQWFENTGSEAFEKFYTYDYSDFEFLR